MTSLRPQRLTRLLVCLSGLTVGRVRSCSLSKQPLRNHAHRPQVIRTIRSKIFRRRLPALRRQPVHRLLHSGYKSGWLLRHPRPHLPRCSHHSSKIPPPQPAPTPANGETLAPDVIEAIEFRGSRRVPQDTLRAIIFSRKGDIYNEDTMRRDFMALWNTNRFDDIRLETEKGEQGGLIVRFVLTERRMVRNITYPGLKSASISDVLDRLKERKVGMVQESMYDPNVINHAAIVIKELLGERGHQFATVTPELHQIPPSSMEVAFVVDEGPKVDVGNDHILGNKAFSRREVINAMKNLKPYGIPHSIFFEELIPKTFDAAKLEEDKERVRDAYGNAGYAQAKVLDQTTKLRATGGRSRPDSTFR